jgi:hypothetical protein
MFERRSLKGCPVTQTTRRENLESWGRAMDPKFFISVSLYTLERPRLLYKAKWITSCDDERLLLYLTICRTMRHTPQQQESGMC